MLAVAAGAHDAHVRSWAAGLRDLGLPALLRLDHEMNGSWYAWSPGVGGNTAADYVAMWRHVRAVFRAEGAEDVGWVWSPNVVYPGSSPLLDCYPGDDAVDWIAHAVTLSSAAAPTIANRSAGGAVSRARW